MIDLGPKPPENRMHLFDPVGLINDNYAQYGPRPRRATSNATGGGLKLSLETRAAESDSNSSSPRLWKPDSRSNSPPASPRFFGSSPPQPSNRENHNHQNSESMSPNSRTQAIARGRRELMEMIKDMPESFYELSLRDIVEQKARSSPPPSSPAAAPLLVTVGVRQASLESKKGQVVEKKIPNQESPPKEKKKKNKKKNKVGKSESKKKMMRNKSVDKGGFFLKATVFRIPFRSKKKKRGLSAAPSFKVASKQNPKGTKRRWWVRKSRVSNENDVEINSRSSSTASGHKQGNRFLPSCCSFFSDKKIKANK